MSNTKTVMSQAANTQGIPLDITDVFSTYLYTGNGATQTITNDIDLAGEGGMTWIKSRSLATDNQLFDTTRGATKELISNTTITEATDTDTLTAFNSNGFSLGGDPTTNTFAATYASWTFRKAPKFFDVVTYTGTGVARTISHNLGGTVGSIIIKKRNATTSNWAVYHRANTVAPETDYLLLNLNNVTADDATYWNDTAPTSTQFTVGTNAVVNASGDTYVAYLFAHNDGDGEFGPNADQDIIKCGSYTGTGLANSLLATLGFEPQWLLVKRTNAVANWIVVDVMRGAVAGGEVRNLYVDLKAAESETGSVAPSAIGIMSGDFAAWNESNASGGTYIYIAIRRGPLAPPESGTEVFNVATGNEIPASEHNYHAGFPVDMAWRTLSTNERAYIATRLTGPEDLQSDTTNAEINNVSSEFDDNVSWYSSVSTNTNAYSHMFRRAPSFFDVVAYTGNGAAGRTLSHNLGVAPEMMWVKSRSSVNEWRVYHKGMNGGTSPEGYFMRLHTNNGQVVRSTVWNDTSPTDTQVTLGTESTVNASSVLYTAYLFTTLAGISKVGSYTGNGTSQTIDCGFTSGARFVLIKRTDTTGDWRYFDSKRGIVAGNDTSAKFNGATVAYRTDVDDIDPDNSGFIINETGTSNLNTSGGSYIFYAIA